MKRLIYKALVVLEKKNKNAYNKLSKFADYAHKKAFGFSHQEKH